MRLATPQTLYDYFPDQFKKIQGFDIDYLRPKYIAYCNGELLW
jgi:hypothetical protein